MTAFQDRLEEWLKNDPEFAEAYNEANDELKKLLIDKHLDETLETDMVAGE